MIIKIDKDAVRQVKWFEYAERFVYGGAMTVVAGLLAERFGPSIGGLFLAFPAIFPASATLIEKHEIERKKKAGFNGTKRGRHAAGVDAAGAALGALGLAMFAVLVWKTLALQPAWSVLVIATLLWFSVGAALWLIRKMIKGARISNVFRLERDH